MGGVGLQGSRENDHRFRLLGQLENKLRAIIDYDMAQSIPLIK